MILNSLLPFLHQVHEPHAIKLLCESSSWPLIQPQKLKAILLCHTCTALNQRNEFTQLKSLQRNTVKDSLFCKILAQEQCCSFMVVQPRSADDTWVPQRFSLVLCKEYWSFLAESGYRTLQFFYSTLLRKKLTLKSWLLLRRGWQSATATLHFICASFATDFVPNWNCLSGRRC